jgi:hypothetical protein
MKKIGLWAFVLPFIVPLTFYPKNHFFSQSSALILTAIFFALVAATAGRDFRISRAIVIWSALGAAWLLSYYFSSPAVMQSFYAHATFWLCGTLVLIAIPTLYAYNTKQEITVLFARFLWILGLLTAIVGLARFYGVLEAIWPWLEVGGDRLIGPLGQPNLTGVVIAVALASFLYLANTQVAIGGVRSWALAGLVVYAGVLTGSRAWIAMMVIVLLMPLLALAINRLKSVHHASISLKRVLGKEGLLAFLLVSLFIVGPQIDHLISQPLIASGFLHRQSADAMMENRMRASDSARIGEWKQAINNTELVDNPWTGVGPGYYGAFSVEAGLMSDNQSRTGQLWAHPHNVFVMALIEWGRVGLLVVVAFACYLAVIFWRSRKSYETIFLFSIIAAICFQNLVEFSLWHFPFLAIFLVALALTDRSYKFSCSSGLLPRSLAMTVLVVGFTLSAYVFKDYYTMSRLFLKDSLTVNDYYALKAAERNFLIGDGALKVAIVRMNPSILDLESQLEEVKRFAQWRPGQSFLMREASLTAALGNEAGACKKLTHLVELFPSAVPAIQSELKALGESDFEIPIERYQECISKGAVYWTSRGRSVPGLM